MERPNHSHRSIKDGIVKLTIFGQWTAVHGKALSKANISRCPTCQNRAIVKTLYSGVCELANFDRNYHHSDHIHGLHSYCFKSIKKPLPPFPQPDTVFTGPEWTVIVRVSRWTTQGRDVSLFILLKHLKTGFMGYVEVKLKARIRTSHAK